jgi:predicted ATPase/class 3 adenylate cyclase
MRQLPSGTVTFLFSDIEGSTKLLHDFGPDAYAEALAEHRAKMRDAFTAQGGFEVDTQGDAFFVAFPTARSALAAARDAQAALADGPIQVRMGIHSGEPLLTEEGYVGIDVHQGARVMSAGHGGQVLVSQATHALVASEFALRDLGRHRLKDLTEPQPLYQLGDGEFPPPKTLSQTNLPVQPSALVGREQELAEVLRLLEHARLVTLTGPGGAGKTRLALQAAAELVDDFPQGVWWISLAALRDPELIETTIGAAVGSQDGLVAHLREKKALLVVDNLEHVLAGAAAQLAAVLSGAPSVWVLATSRERLGLTGEHEYAVPSMALAEAVALFTARAQQLKPDFQPDATVREICRRLDGLPLAVELVAARVKVLRPEQILDRLGRRLELLTTGARDAPERQQTLRAAIEWSFDLLADHERHLFTCLAIFPGSFDIDAAEAVCGADLDAVASLLDKSLLRQTAEGRFFMLETIREFALERVEEDGGLEDLRRRHSRYVVEFLEAASEYLRRPGQEPWLEAIARHHEDLRAALAWADAADDDALRLTIAAHSSHFWYSHGHISEGLRYLERALAASKESSEMRGLALRGAAALAGSHGEYERARDWADESVSILSEVSEPREVLMALTTLAAIVVDMGEPERAKELSDRALTLARREGDDFLVAMILANLCNLALTEHDYRRAVDVGRQCSELLERLGVAHGLAITWSNIGLAELALGNVAKAESLFADALRLAREHALAEVMVWCLTGLAAVAARTNELERAATLLGAVDMAIDSTGIMLEPAEQELFDETRSLAEDALGPDRFGSALDAGRTLELEAVADMAAAGPLPTAD